MRRSFALLFSLVLLFAFAHQAQAQSEVEVTGVKVTYTFGDQINFSARIQTQSSILEAFLLFQVEGDQNTHTIPISVAPDGQVNYQYLIQTGLIRPFAQITYWFHLRLNNEVTYDSPQISFWYDDTRYPWQTVEDATISLHWYDGAASFGQSAFDAARAGYQAIQSMIPINLGDPIDIYIYATAGEIQDMLNLGGYTWIGGHASPDLGVVLVSIADNENQTIEMERQIPHELAHVLLYRLTGPAYVNLPTWLIEGIASQSEQYQNADYAQVLAIATQGNSLAPIANLCGPFPADASGAILAYAESDSFTRYLHDTYGSLSMLALTQAYSGGLNCEEGPVRALGVPLSRLDMQWKQSALGMKMTGLAFQNLLPYLLLLGVILVIPALLFGIGMRRKG